MPSAPPKTPLTSKFRGTEIEWRREHNGQLCVRETAVLAGRVNPLLDFPTSAACNARRNVKMKCGFCNIDMGLMSDAKIIEHLAQHYKDVIAEKDREITRLRALSLNMAKVLGKLCEDATKGLGAIHSAFHSAHKEIEDLLHDPDKNEIPQPSASDAGGQPESLEARGAICCPNCTSPKVEKFSLGNELDEFRYRCKKCGCCFLTREKQGQDLTQDLGVQTKCATCGSTSGKRLGDFWVCTECKTTQLAAE